MGTVSFLQQYVERKVDDGWVKELEKLSKIAAIQPHAAYAAFTAFTHGFSSKWNHLIRVSNWKALSSSDLL